MLSCLAEMVKASFMASRVKVVKQKSGNRLSQHERHNHKDSMRRDRDGAKTHPAQLASFQAPCRRPRCPPCAPQACLKNSVFAVLSLPRTRQYCHAQRLEQRAGWNTAQRKRMNTRGDHNEESAPQRCGARLRDVVGQRVDICQSAATAARSLEGLCKTVSGWAPAFAWMTPFFFDLPQQPQIQRSDSLAVHSTLPAPRCDCLQQAPSHLAQLSTCVAPGSSKCNPASMCRQPMHP